jgi:hypothetical protein
MRARLLVAAFALVGALSVSSRAQTLSRVAITVLDPTELAVPGATVVLSRDTTAPLTSTTDSGGVVTFEGVATGTYRASASLSGFSDAAPITVRITRPGTSQVTLKLGWPTANETVTVDGGADAGTASQDTTVSKDQLPQNLSDDPTILQSTIDALAGAGSTVRVDGLASGGLPPTSTIQQIRIRQNAFDAEFHEASPAFVEIITSGKPMPWQANVSTFGRFGPLQARNAFNPDAPAARQAGLNVNANGNLANRASVVFFGNYNAMEEDTPLFAQMPAGPVRGLVSNPSQFSFTTLRVGLDNWHRQNIRVESDYQDQRNLDLGAGGFNLADRGWDRDQTTVRLRGFWTKTFGKGGSQVLRTQFQRQIETDSPKSQAPAVVVLNAFSSGGAQLQGTRIVNQVEVSDVVTLPVGKRQVWRSGLLLWHGAYDSTIVNNAGGTFTFSSLPEYVAGRPATFTERQGAGLCCFGVSQLGIWTADDISVSKTVNLAIGLRQEFESDTSQRVHLAPRGQLDWSPRRVPHTTFRVGAGIFYAWFNPTDIEQTVRVDGVHQQDLLVINPGFPDPTVGTDATALPSGRYLRASTLTLPRLIRSSIGVDRTRGRLFLHVDYTHQTGSQLYRGQNLNAPDGTSVRPDPQFGNVIEVQSTGRSRLDAVTVSASFSDPKHSRGVRMNYTFARAFDDTDGAFFLPVDPVQADSEWGPSSRDVRHRLGGTANATMFGHLNLATYWQFSSPLPYTITTGVDRNADGIFNDRPSGATRNGARGFAYFDQGIFLGWQWPRVSGPTTPAPTRRVTLQLNVTNVWNRVNRTAVSGVLTSPYFGQAISASQPRRVYVGVSTGI